MARGKVKADCRADTRGSRWAGIPVCVIESAAYRDLSLWARAILVEIVARMNGWNNGEIAISAREMATALGSQNFGKIAKGTAELIEHGLLDVSLDGPWKERKAREYRLTFVSTKTAGATNEYRQWVKIEKSGAEDVSAGKGQSAEDVSAGRRNSAEDVSARIADHRRKSANSQNGSAEDVSALICKPYPPVAESKGEGGIGASEKPSYSERPSVANCNETAFDEERLRREALALVKRVGRGAQGRLASDAGINEGKFSTFLHHRVTLPAPSLARLNRALSRAEA